MVVKFGFSISISPTAKMSIPIFIYENNLFMLYNVQCFSVKSAFCVKFMASFLLVKLIIQQ